MSRRSREKRSQRLTQQAAASQAAKRPSSPLSSFPSLLSGNSGQLLGYSVILAAATFLLYFPIIRHPFIYFDDEVYIYENPFLRSGLDLGTVKWAFTSLYASNWHPLTWLAHALNVQLFGLDPGGHHFASLFLHAGNVVLLYLVLNFAFRAPNRCLLVAALFALHPQNVESVAWAAELKNLLCTFFFFIAIGAYLYYARKPSVVRYLMVVVAFAFALAAKPMAVTLPFVLLLLDYWPLSRLRGLTQPGAADPAPQLSAVNLAIEKVPLLVLGAASCWITLRAQTAGEATTMVHASFGLRITNAIVSYATYLLKMLWPAGLTPFYPFPEQGIPVWQVLLSALILVGISAAVLFYGGKRGYLVVGWLWFLGTLVPVIGLLQVGAQSRADRYVYIPMIGILLMVVWGLSELAERLKWALFFRVAPAVAVALVLSAVTSRQIGYWRSPFTLWSHTIEVTGENAVAEHNLSTELFRVGRNNEALPHAVRAVYLNPSDWVSHNYLGVYFLSQGKKAEAIREFKMVIENSKDPKLVVAATIDMGSSYFLLGQLDDAESAYHQALALSPNNSAALAGLNGVMRARARGSSSSVPIRHQGTS